MADNPTSPPQKSIPAPSGGDPIPTPTSSLQNPNLPSPSPSMELSSPRLPNPQINASQQIQMQQQQLHHQQQQLQQQRTGSSQIARLQQQYGSVAAASAMRQHAGIYGGQVSFGGTQSQLQQQQAGLIGQVGGGGQLPVLPGQAGTSQLNLQQQMLAQTRQKSGSGQSSQFLPANSSGQTLQGMQPLNMINSLGLKNGQLSSYAQAAQQRLNQGMRQLQTPQAQLSSPQKLSGQTISQSSSLASMNSQLSGMAQNGQASLIQNPLSQQQWLKQTQMAMAGAGSPSYQLQQQQQHQRQRQAFLQQQLQKSMGLNPRQFSQLVQQQAQLGAHQQQQHNLQVSQPALMQQQHLQSLQVQQQQQQLQLQQQQSPRIPGPATQKSLSLTGSQPETPASGTTTPGGSSSQGTEANNHQLIGKRKIQDLVSQVDSLAKLEPEVEDILLELADEFIESVTTFACNLAKHRKSSVLEPKDLLLHLEKNWHLSIPGYTREEQKFQRKHMTDDIHKRRLEMIQALLESTQAGIDTSSSKGTLKLNMHETTMETTLRSSAGPDQIISPSVGTSMVKVPRF